MTYDSARAATMWRSVNRAVGRGAVALLSLTLVFAPLAGHAAAFAAKDTDVIGNWGSDAKDPANHYRIVAGPRPGEYQLISPKAKAPPVVLRRVAADTFASPKGTAPTAKFTLTAGRNAELYIHDESKKGLSFTFLLLNKQ